MKAPFSGIVSARQVSAGDIVQIGAMLYTVVNPATMRLEASVPADQLSAVHVGAPVDFSVNGYPGRAFTGRITRINPVADPATRQVRIIASLPNASGVGWPSGVSDFGARGAGTPAIFCQISAIENQIVPTIAPPKTDTTPPRHPQNAPIIPRNFTSPKPIAS